MLKIEVIDCWDKEALLKALKPFEGKISLKPKENSNNWEIYTPSQYVEEILNSLAILWEGGVIEDFIPPPTKVQF